MSGNATGRVGRRLATAASIVIALAVGACGGGDGGDTTAATVRTLATPVRGVTPELPPAFEAAAQFARNFRVVTGVRLTPDPTDLGTRLEPFGEPDRRARLGDYELIWSNGDAARRELLGAGPPGGDGLWWRRAGDGGWTVGAQFGPRLVAASPQRVERVASSSWIRLQRAIEAAMTGDVLALPDAEEPCRLRRLNPLRGPEGACARDGMPTTFVDGDRALRTGLLDARVLGVETPERLTDREGRVATTVASQRFVVVGYRVRNVGGRLMRRLEPGLHIDGRTFRAMPSAPGAPPFPIGPSETFTANALFTVPAQLAARVRTAGALVLPIGETDEQPDADVEQGWIRLAQTSRTIP